MWEQLADQIYSYMAGPKGFTPKAKIDMDGVQKVLELRSVYGEPKKALTDPTKYYDSKYYDAADRDGENDPWQLSFLILRSDDGYRRAQPTVSRNSCFQQT